MTIALVSWATASGTNSFSTSSIDTTGATLLVAAVAHYNGQPAAAISDSKGNTWTPLTLQASSITAIRLYYAFNPTVGTGHTFSQGTASSFSAITVSAWSGTDATSAVFDTEQGGYVGTADMRVGSSSLVPSAANELLIVGWAENTTTGSGYAGANGFTYLGGSSYVGGTSVGSLMAYQIQTSATTVAAATPIATFAPVGETRGASAAFISGGGAVADTLMGQACL